MQQSIEKAEDVITMEKVHRILKKGNDVEIRRGNDGKVKVLEITKHLA